MDFVESMAITNAMESKEGLIISKLLWERLEDTEEDGDMEFMIQVADKEAYNMFMKDMYFNRSDMVRLRDFLNKHL